MKRLKELCQVVSGQLQGADIPFSSVSIDTRTLQPGALFIAIRGQNFDGHDFIADLHKSGAVAAVVSREMVCSLPLVQVKDTQLALGEIAAHQRRQFTLPIVSLTGSCGKTTVKEMIAAILRQQGNRLIHPTSLSSYITFGLGKQIRQSVLFHFNSGHRENSNGRGHYHRRR